MVYIVVAILLAIVGNAIWEYLLRPLCSRCPRLIWGGISHLSRRFANSIVQKAAQRRGPALKSVLFVSVSIVAIAFGVSTGIGLRAAWSPPGWDSIFAQYQAAESLPLPQREAALHTLVERIQVYRTERELETDRKLDYVCLLLSICLAVFLFDAVKTYFAYVIAAKFEWLLQARKRTSSDAQIRELEWKWAAMQTTEDLDHVWNLLRSS